jgi:hypothetical protein
MPKDRSLVIILDPDIAGTYADTQASTMLGGQVAFQLGDLGDGYSLDTCISADSLGKHIAIEMFGSQITIDAANQDFCSIGNTKLAVVGQSSEPECTITVLN